MEPEPRLVVFSIALQAARLVAAASARGKPGCYVDASTLLVLVEEVRALLVRPPAF